jgi:hypothetical protein
LAFNRIHDIISQNIEHFKKQAVHYISKCSCLFNVPVSSLTENSDETDEEEDDVTQQTPILLLPKSAETRLTNGPVR